MASLTQGQIFSKNGCLPNNQPTYFAFFLVFINSGFLKDIRSEYILIPIRDIRINSHILMKLTWLDANREGCGRSADKRDNLYTLS